MYFGPPRDWPCTTSTLKTYLEMIDDELRDPSTDSSGSVILIAPDSSGSSSIHHLFDAISNLSSGEYEFYFAAEH